METRLKCGIKFCGGCNPRYDRGRALEHIKEHFKDRDIEFLIAREEDTPDLLLVIGGCTNCCASYEQFKPSKGVLKIWDEAHVKSIFDIIEDKMIMED